MFYTAQACQPGNSAEVVEKANMCQGDFVLVYYLSQTFPVLETAVPIIGNLDCGAGFAKAFGQLIFYLLGKNQSDFCCAIAKFLAKPKMNVFLACPGSRGRIQQQSYAEILHEETSTSSR